MRDAENIAHEAMEAFAVVLSQRKDAEKDQIRRRPVLMPACRLHLTCRRLSCEGRGKVAPTQKADATQSPAPSEVTFPRTDLSPIQQKLQRPSTPSRKSEENPILPRIHNEASD